jgi:hypothetical protein
MPAHGSAIVPTRVEHSFDVDAELGRVFGDGVRPLHFEQALVDAMLAGWARQQQSRMLCRCCRPARWRVAAAWSRALRGR